MAKQRTRASVSELKASLSRYLRQVQVGEEVIVTDRHRPIAKLVPVEHRDAPDKRLERLEREGRIRLGTGKIPPGFWQLPRIKDPNALVRRALNEERQQGR